MEHRRMITTLAALAALLLFGCLRPAAAGEGEDMAQPRKGRLAPNIIARGGLANARARFLRDRKGHAAFIGGSITEMDGYRPMVCQILKDKFPQTLFTFTDAGIASTCSTTGAFRLHEDVLSKGPVDLLVVEFAVNDTQDAAHTRRECIRGMEGIVRQARRHNPNADIIFVYFVNPEMLAEYQQEAKRDEGRGTGDAGRGTRDERASSPRTSPPEPQPSRGKTPLAIAAHEEVARHYGLPSINLAKEVAQRIKAGEFDWKKFGGTHPAPFGNRICARMIQDLMAYSWAEPLAKDAAAKPYPMPADPLDPLCYAQGRFVDVKEARLQDGWQVHVPPWGKLKGACRGRFKDLSLLTTDKPGATLTLDFSGTAVGAYVLAGPDAGIVEASIDGGPARKVDLYHHFSRGLHYPRTCMFDADLKPGKHKLTLRMTPEHNPASIGTAMRILHFTVNGP